MGVAVVQSISAWTKRHAMRLESLVYAQHEGSPQEWRIEGCSLGDINLLVGRNASGKTRTVNVMKNLGKLVCGEAKPRFRSGQWEAWFASGDHKTKYSLKCDESRIVRESLERDGAPLMTRGQNGEGRIFAKRVGDQGSDIDFQVPVGELACVARRDSVQHPFFEPLYQWGKRMRAYPFGTPLGKDQLVVFGEGESEAILDLKDPNCVVPLFKRAQDELGDAFVEAVRNDLATLGYSVDSLRLSPPHSMKVHLRAGGEPQCLVVKEHDLPGMTDQHDMSQGMFRAMALIIHLNYAERTEPPSCVIVDDIGEGLDFERSSALISVLMEKAKRSSIQLIMATNDRFVMNRVDLQYWCVTERLPNGCRIHNYRNSREAFEQFELTGLSNFDFFASGALDGSSAAR